MRKSSYHILLFLSLPLLLCLASGRAYAGPPPAPAGSDAVVVEGDPALTAAMLTRFTDFMGWAFEAPFTQEQRDRIRAAIIASWKAGKQAEIDGVIETLKAAAVVDALPPDQRALVLVRIQPALVESLRQQKDDADSQWLLGIYEAAHNPIAAGVPPLTRQISDALAEMFAFMLGEVSGQQIDADRKFKDGWATWLIGAYPKLPPNRQAQWGEAPVAWASLRVSWEKADAAERAKVRKQWSAVFQSAVPLVKDRSEVAALIKELSGLAEQQAKTRLTADQLDHTSGLLLRLAAILRKDGGGEGGGAAAQLEEAAGELKNQAIAQRQPGADSKQPGPESGAKQPGNNLLSADSFRRISERSASYMDMMNRSMFSFETRMEHW